MDSLEFHFYMILEFQCSTFIAFLSIFEVALLLQRN